MADIFGALTLRELHDALGAYLLSHPEHADLPMWADTGDYSEPLAAIGDNIAPSSDGSFLITKPSTR